jgi:hypothetical protein
LGTFKTAKQGSEISWDKLKPAEHLVYIYDDEESFLDSLESFVAAGILADEFVAVIATAPHLKSLETRLESSGIDVAQTLSGDRYIPIDADQTLAEITDDDGWPNDDRFSNMIDSLFARAEKGGRRLRAYGGLASLLWAKGHNAATLRLESLWDSFCRERSFTVLHAYPKAGFTDYHLKSLHDLCEMHSRVIR